MTRTTGLALMGVLLSTSLAVANAPRFGFQKGQVLTYKVEQTTHATETVLDEKTNQPVTQTTVTKLNLVKNWKVADVDAKGIITLELSLTSMRLERKAPTGEPDVFDSAKPDKDNADMMRLIGKRLAVLRINPRGDLVDVKESNFGPASRFVTDLPFKIVLPEASLAAGQTWDRSYTIKLDPPQGTGETYAATQSYTSKEAQNGFAVVGVTTKVKDMPASAIEQIPLLPLMPEGDVFFHAESGVFYAARFKIKKELVNHQGEGSKYAFITAYSEDYVPAPK